MILGLAMGATMLAGCGGEEAPAPALGRWLGAERIDGSPSPDAPRAGLPDLGMDGSGRAIVVWTQNIAIWANRFIPGRGWGQPEAVATLTQAHAGQPVIAVNDSGTILVVWEQLEGESGPTHVWASRGDPSTGWSPPEIIDESAVVDTPSFAAAVGLDSAGNGMALWVSDGIVAAAYRAGQGWSRPERLSRSGFGPILAVDAVGRVLAAWGEGGDTLVAVQFDPARGWSPSTRFGPTAEGDNLGPARLAIDSSGRAVLVWERRIGVFGPAVVWAARFDAGRFTDASVISDRSVKSYSPAVALSHGGALAAWTLLGSPPSETNGGVGFNRFAFGSSWGVPGLATSAPDAVTLDLAMNAGGDAFAVWSQLDPKPGTPEEKWYRLSASRYTGEAWSPAQALQAGPGPAQYPVVAVDPASNGLAVWAEDEGVSTRIWANRFEVNRR